MENKHFGVKDLAILCRLRLNARENLTKMSRKTRIPVSTLHDRIKKYHGDVITKSTVLLNFQKLGYEFKVKVLLKTSAEKKEALEKFLFRSENVNNLYRVNNGYDYLAEAVFKNLSEFKEFTEKLKELGVNSVQEFLILEDLKKEAFLTQEALYAAW